jgi:hypothetical protein
MTCASTNPRCPAVRTARVASTFEVRCDFGSLRHRARGWLLVGSRGGGEPVGVLDPRRRVVPGTSPAADRRRARTTVGLRRRGRRGRTSGSAATRPPSGPRSAAVASRIRRRVPRASGRSPKRTAPRTASSPAPSGRGPWRRLAARPVTGPQGWAPTQVPRWLTARRRVDSFTPAALLMTRETVFFPTPSSSDSGTSVSAELRPGVNRRRPPLCGPRGVLPQYQTENVASALPTGVDIGSMRST